MAKCKRCGLKTTLEDSDIAAMVDKLRKSGMRLVGDEEYDRRIAICMKCEKLGYGSTCMLCGAVVRARCLMEGGKCPYPKGAKW